MQLPASTVDLGLLPEPVRHQFERGHDGLFHLRTLEKGDNENYMTHLALIASGQVVIVEPGAKRDDESPIEKQQRLNNEAAARALAEMEKAQAERDRAAFAAKQARDAAAFADAEFRKSHGGRSQAELDELARIEASIIKH